VLTFLGNQEIAGDNAAATAVEDDDKDSVAAMLHRQLRIYKGGSPEEPVWFPDI
jgi:hypothetical protein